MVTMMSVTRPLVRTTLLVAAAAAAAAAAQAAADAQAAIYKGFTDKLENGIVHNSTATNPQGQPVQATAASCTVISVNAVGGGTYDCDVTSRNGSQYGTITVPANGDWTRWVPPK